jgi:hypothetical protein
MVLYIDWVSLTVNHRKYTGIHVKHQITWLDSSLDEAISLEPNVDKAASLFGSSIRDHTFSVQAQLCCSVIQTFIAKSQADLQYSGRGLFLSSHKIAETCKPLLSVFGSQFTPDLLNYTAEKITGIS